MLVMEWALWGVCGPLARCVMSCRARLGIDVGACNSLVMPDLHALQQAVWQLGKPVYGSVAIHGTKCG